MNKFEYHGASYINIRDLIDPNTENVYTKRQINSVKREEEKVKTLILSNGSIKKDNEFSYPNN